MNLETGLTTFELEIPLRDNDLITGFDPTKDIFELKLSDLLNSAPVQIDNNNDEVFQSFQSELETENFQGLNDSNSRELIFASKLSSTSLDLTQFSVENDGLDTRQRFENVAFFKAPGDKWSQPGGKGNPVNITYSFTNLLNGKIKGLNVGEVKAAIEEAFGTWSSVAPINFTEVKDGRNSQIRIGQKYIDGRSGTLAYAYFPRNGDITFDNGENWRINLFLETAVHEIGHSLGLDHEDKVDSIMNSYAGPDRYKGLGTAFLLKDDIQGIRSLYGKGRGSVNPLGGNPPSPPSNLKRINGTMSDDVLIGNDRNNVIRGFAGNDEIEGGKGNDIIKGGKGVDTFIFKSLDGSIDTIRDFSLAEGDRLEISRSGFGASSKNDFRYDDSSGGLFFGNQQFAILANTPLSSDVRSGLVIT